MVRGAAKNHATVAIVTDPADYALVASRVADGTGFSLDERKWLAAKAFAHTAAYDATINEWTAKHWPKPASLDAVEVDKDDQGTEVDSAKFPAQFTRTWDRAHTLRYGENSHQQAALYIDPLNQTGFAHAEQLGGKPMSYNNYVDADAAWRTVWDMAPAIAVAVVKHNNPCGLAIGATAAEAHKVAAVLRPDTDAPCFRITPAPRKPMPEATCAATRVGSPLLPPATAISLTSTNRVDPNATSALVRMPALRARNWRSSPISAPNAVPSTMRTVQSRITARENVVNMRIHLLKKGVRNFPHTLQRQPASRNCVAAFGWFELRAVSGPRPYDGSAGGPGFSAYGGRRHGSY